MTHNKQSTRAFTAFVVTWAFLVLTVTGVVLYTRRTWVFGFSGA